MMQDNDAMIRNDAMIHGKEERERERKREYEPTTWAVYR